MRTEVLFLHEVQEALKPIEEVLPHEEQLVWTKTGLIEQAGLHEPCPDTIALQEVVKLTEAQHLVVVFLEVVHLVQDIVEHEVALQEPRPTEVLEVEPTVELIEVAQEVLRAEVLTDLAVLVEVAEATVHQVVLQEALAVQEAQGDRLDHLIQEEDLLEVVDHLVAGLREDDLVVAEGVNKSFKFQ